MSKSPVVGVALACIVIPMPEVLVSGLVGGGQEGVESTQPANKTVHTVRERLGLHCLDRRAVACLTEATHLS